MTFAVNFLTECSGKMDFKPVETRDKPDTRTVPRQMKALETICMAAVRRGRVPSALDNTLHHSSTSVCLQGVCYQSKPYL
jgi:hypothetical protein